MISIVLALTERDLKIASEIMNEAADWLADQGKPLWKKSRLTVEFLRPHLTNRELYLALADGEPAGTIVVQDKDEDFWPEVTDGSSFFFHKLVVRRSFAGIGVSKALIDKAYELSKAHNKQFLRMDCSATHPLRKFYEGHGFQFVDQKIVYDLLVDRLFKTVI